MTNAPTEFTNPTFTSTAVSLLPVVIGGVIGLLGALIGPLIHGRIDRRRQRRQKLETLRSYIGEIRYYAVWSKTAATFFNEFKGKFAEMPKMTAIARQEFAPVCAKLDELIPKLDRYLVFADMTVNLGDPTGPQDIGENKKLLKEITQLTDEIEGILTGLSK